MQCSIVVVGGAVMKGFLASARAVSGGVADGGRD